MADRRFKIQLPGGEADAVEVGVAESTERWTDIHLEDGSHIRVKNVIVAAARVEGQFDQEGNPVYSLRINQIMTIASAPEHLRKGATGSPKGDVH